MDHLKSCFSLKLDIRTLKVLNYFKTIRYFTSPGKVLCELFYACVEIASNRNGAMSPTTSIRVEYTPDSRDE